MRTTDDLPADQARTVDDETARAAALVPAGVSEMGIDDALQLAVKLHRDDRLEGARTLYERILQAVPGHADALGFLGVLEHQAGRSELGLTLLRQAIEQVPGFLGFHLNLGNVLVEMHRLDEALQAFGQAVAIDPTAADTHNNIGAVHRALGHFDEAADSYRRALELDPGHWRAWNNLGLLHDACGDPERAMRAYLKSIECAPGQRFTAYLLGMAFYRSGQIDRATEVFRQWMLSDPADPVPAHLYAACSGQNVPDRASNAYVEVEFDRFAASFERVLNDKLDYRAPKLCADLLASCLPAPERSLEVLDAGCGTGLCGPLVAPWARRLVGVDLSAGMLAKARSKGVYDDLIKAELTSFMQGTPDAWDAIVCADTLCYFGDLTAVLRAAASALRPGAVMVFTVEALADDGADRPAILHNGRYAHGRAHLDQAAAVAGLTTLRGVRDVLRNEGGAPVQGWVMALARPA